MATVTIRKLDDGVVERLKERARTNRRSMEEDLRELVTRYAAPRLQGRAAVDYFTRHRVTPLKPVDSLAIIRAMRYGDDEDDFQDEPDPA